MKKQINSDQGMKQFGAWLASQLPVNFCLELIGDVGAGKTTLTKGLVNSLNSDLEATSPSFVINNRYQINENRVISHYDFYRLGSIGIDDQQLAEDILDKNTGVIIEWAESVNEVLPENRVIIDIKYIEEGNRIVDVKGIEE